MLFALFWTLVMYGAMQLYIVEYVKVDDFIVFLEWKLRTWLG
jgi:hypothetical protein